MIEEDPVHGIDDTEETDMPIGDLRHSHSAGLAFGLGPFQRGEHDLTAVQHLLGGLAGHLGRRGLKLLGRQRRAPLGPIG